jgi:hypothetical protein
MLDCIFAGGGPRLRRVVAISALCAFPAAAMAGDVAPTPDGAQKLTEVLSRYVGRGALSVAVEGDHYTASLDLAKLLAPIGAQGVSVDAAPAKVNLVEQSDGAWRVARGGYMPMTFNVKEGAVSIQVDGYKFDGLFDPALSGFRTAETKMDKADIQVRAPEFDETLTFAPGQATVAGSAAAGGGYTGTVKENVGQMTVLVTPKTPEKTDGGQASSPASPVSIKLGGLSYEVSLDNMRLRELLDLWAFFVAHPSRAALATDEAALKAKLRALLPLVDKLNETFSAQNIEIDTPKGAVKLGDVKGRFGADKFPSSGDMEVHVAAAGISPPPGVIPAPFSGLVPTSIDVNVKYGGYDYAAAAEEAIDDMHLAGEGPILSDADRAKIPVKMMGGGPLHFTILPSRIVAPQLDVSLEGDLQVTGSRPVGKMTVTARNFDNTVSAIKGAGPQVATPQLVAGLALAKGLGKTEADGSLTWVAEYGADGAIKVNGLALGKAPAQ